MLLNPVQSTSIAEVGYDREAKIMRLRFKASRNFYDFAGVEPHEHKAFMESKSIGKHFGEHIQPKHKATRVKK